MVASSRNTSEPVVQVCEHCLYVYGWQEEKGKGSKAKVHGFPPPYPCPRCGYLQEVTCKSLLKKTKKRYLSWLVVLCAGVLFSTFLVSTFSVQWGIRPTGPIAIGGAILLIATGVWSGMFRYITSLDPNANLDRRRKFAAAARDSQAVLDYQELKKKVSDPEELPTPPAWSWDEAEKRYRSVPSRITFRRSLLRGFLYGLVPALICLGSGKVYLDLTRADWEYSHLYNGDRNQRSRAIEYLWNSGDETHRELVAQWFSTAPLTSQEADIYLIHLKPLRSHNYQKILTGILAMQTGIPGPQAWKVLKQQPDLVAKRILYYLDKGVGDPARNLAILANLDPETLAITFEREISVKPELIHKLGQFSMIVEKSWPVIAKGVLRSTRGDRRLALNMVNALLKAAPKGSLDPLLDETLDSLGDWVVEPVANDPEKYLPVALFDPRPEWFEVLIDGIVSATDENLIPLSVAAGDAITSLGPDYVTRTLDPMFASADRFRWLKLRVLARHNPIQAASECARTIDSYVQREWGTLTQEVLAEQKRWKTDLLRMAQTLEGIPLDENWIKSLRNAYKIRDPKIRHEWTRLLANAPPAQLLEVFGQVGGAKEYARWEVDSLVESIAENPEASLEEIASLLLDEDKKPAKNLSPVVKYALLEYLAKVGDSSLVPIVENLTEDSSTVLRSSPGIDRASETLRIGDFAREVVATLEKRTE